MKIWVSSLANVHDVAASARPGRVVSLLSPADAFPRLKGVGDEHHYKMHLHDIREELADHITPAAAHIEGLIGFLDDWRRDEPLLVHCWAGISRSTAAAFIAACLHNPQADEHAIAGEMRRVSPTAYPNTRIVAFADEILGRNGRMSAAVEAIGRGDIVDMGTPFFIPGRF